MALPRTHPLSCRDWHGFDHAAFHKGVQDLEDSFMAALPFWSDSGVDDLMEPRCSDTPFKQRLHVALSHALEALSLHSFQLPFPQPPHDGQRSNLDSLYHPLWGEKSFLSR
jgi:hypothetical protein